MITHTNAESSSLFSLFWLKGLGKTVVDLLFPPHCVVCRCYGTWFCDECLEAVEVIRPPVCVRCGLPLHTPGPSRDPASSPTTQPSIGRSLGAESLCSRCKKAPPRLDGLRAYAYHRGPLRVAIQQFKYNNLRCLAAPLAKLMCQGWSTLFPDPRIATIIVPVPLHSTRERERGYNQAALLANELAPILGYPVARDALLRTRKTAPQVGLGVEERRDNVRGAFACSGESLAGTRVLLIDDVYTSGSTMEAAGVALREGGVLSVWAYTLARAG